MEVAASILDIVITVCGNAANETCPVFPRDCMRSHWGLPDPAATHGTDVLREAFHHARKRITQRLSALLALPLETLRRDELQRALDRIGTITGKDEATA